MANAKQRIIMLLQRVTTLELTGSEIATICNVWNVYYHLYVLEKNNIITSRALGEFYPRKYVYRIKEKL